MVGENVCVFCTHFIEIKTNYKYIFPVNLWLDPIALQFCVGIFDFSACTAACMVDIGSGRCLSRCVFT